MASGRTARQVGATGPPQPSRGGPVSTTSVLGATSGTAVAQVVEGAIQECARLDRLVHQARQIGVTEREHKPAIRIVDTTRGGQKIVVVGDVQRVLRAAVARD